ncbi:Craniofacial development protein 2 [Xyrichtys novacula]|uniref:Craniofacial development protein 2 n=1 Tax=Xyrichtys novacula TaxID=13765 RepID=A0AAV1HP04_XYRNO|nr:Craniofacial development protein 2 [Xyrichtys novacula]
MSEFGLLAANAQFQKRRGKLWTFKSPTDALYQLDYILIRRKWRNSLLNAEAYNSFCSVGSDHRVVCAKIRLSLRTAKQPKKTRYDWKRFAVSPDIQHDYTVEVMNRFQVLEEDDNGARYEKFVEANRQAMEDCVPLKPKRKSVHTSTNPQVVAARERVDDAHTKWDTDSTDDNRAAWRRALIELYTVYDQVKEQELEEQTRTIEEAFGAQQYGEAWKVVNEISGRKRAKEGQVSGNSPEERVTTWDINDEPFTLDEFRKVKASLKLGKAAGPDNIPPEVFKCCDFDEICLQFCNDALMKNDKPDLWTFMNIIPVPKTGDLSNTNNYRGISLICIVAKVYNRMILNRIRSVIDMKLRINQNGFRPGRSTVAQILTLRRIIEGVKANNLPAIITFIDFKKAFHSIHRAKMMRILKAYGIPPNLLRAIEAMYYNTKARIMTPDGETEQFDITAGVLQGDTLAPFLFIIVLDYALRKALADGKEEELGFTITPRRSRRHPKEVLADLDFADDIALLSDTVEQAQELLLRVETECNKVGLGLNGPKTKYLAYNIDDHPPLARHSPLVTRNGTVLEEKNDFRYLGSWLMETLSPTFLVNGKVSCWSSAAMTTSTVDKQKGGETGCIWERWSLQAPDWLETLT